MRGFLDWSSAMNRLRSVFTKHLADFPAKMRAFVANLAIMIIVIAVAITFIRQLTNKAILLEPIKVPSTFATAGYTPEVTAQWIMDEMLDIQRQAMATTRKQSHLIAPEWQRFDMEVPGSGITLSSLGRALRESLGIAEKKISGEILPLDSGYQVRLRMSGGKVFSHVRYPEQQNIDRIISSTAEQAVRILDPFIYASYLYAANRVKEVEAAIQYCLTREPAEDDKWAYNLMGTLKHEQGDRDGAISNYARAASAENFAFAYYNWANILHEMKRHEEALEKLQRAVEIEPDLYDAAREAAFRVELGRYFGRFPERHGDELEQYRRAFALNPKDSVALLWWGIALMKQSSPDYRAAAGKFAEIERLDRKSTSPEVYAKWGDALRSLGDYDAAITKYNAAMAKDREGFAFLQEKIDAIVARESNR